jgi:PAS domain S-box-containing protein
MAKLRKSGDKRQKRNNAIANPPAVSREWEDIFQAIGQPSFILKPDSSIIDCNKAVADLTGKPTKYFIGKKCCEVFHGRKSPPEGCPMERVLKSGKFETSEMDVEALGMTFLISCTPVFNKAGKIHRIIHIANDVTERRQMEQEIREGEERLSIILENLPDAVFAHDLDGRIIQVNKMACTMTGYTRQELTSLTVGDIDEGSITRKDRETIWRRLKKGDSFLLVNAIHRRKDGSHYPAEIRINSIVLNKQPVMLALAQDVTERKRDEERLGIYQERLKALTAELSMAEEQERRRIAVGVHDNLGQKLAMAKLSLQVLKESVPQQNIRNELGRECDKMDEILADVRALTFELSNPVLYELGLKAAVRGWLENEIKGKAGLKYELASSGEEAELNDDIKVVVFQAIRELSTNTVKHSGAGTVKVNIDSSDSQIIVTVEDDGNGFDTGKLGLPSGTGGGFGLFSIRERLEYLGGQLKIESGPRKGTRITITVPVKHNGRAGEIDARHVAHHP